MKLSKEEQMKKLIAYSKTPEFQERVQKWRDWIDKENEEGIKRCIEQHENYIVPEELEIRNLLGIK